jgi:hypothetical protein
MVDMLQAIGLDSGPLKSERCTVAVIRTVALSVRVGHDTLPGPGPVRCMAEAMPHCAGCAHECSSQ